MCRQSNNQTRDNLRLEGQKNPSIQTCSWPKRHFLNGTIQEEDVLLSSGNVPGEQGGESSSPILKKPCPKQEVGSCVSSIKG
jgi:hypothetical protein